MALADIIAARKAEAAKKAEMQAQAQAQPQESAANKELPVSFQNLKNKEEQKQEEKKEETKILTFAEKMRLKREQEEAKAIMAVVKQEIAATKEQATPEEQAIPEEKEQIASEEKEDKKEESKEEESNEDKIAYINIKEKIDALDSFMDDELPEPMGELKRALLANPNACLLMLDEDIGKMTIALRRLVQESLVEKAEKKPKGRKTKNTGQLNLSAEDIDKVFAELDDF